MKLSIPIKGPLRDGLLLVLVIVIYLTWSFPSYLLWWSMPPRGNDVGPGQPGVQSNNPYLGNGPYEEWAREMEDSDREEPHPKPQFIFAKEDPSRLSPFARVLELNQAPALNPAAPMADLDYRFSNGDFGVEVPADSGFKVDR